jgi:hypothetical protein
VAANFRTSQFQFTVYNLGLGLLPYHHNSHQSYISQPQTAVILTPDEDFVDLKRFNGFESMRYRSTESIHTLNASSISYTRIPYAFLQDERISFWIQRRKICSWRGRCTQGDNVPSNLESQAFNLHSIMYSCSCDASVCSPWRIKERSAENH